MQANNEKTVIALKAASKEIKTFVDSAEKEVAIIEKEYLSIVPDAESKEGYQFCKEVRKDVLPIKSRMEEARKTLKRPIIDMGKIIDSSLNPLTLRLENVYKPFEDAYREKDNEKKKHEEERQAKINAAFGKLNDSAMEAIGQTSIVIESIMEDIAYFDFDPKVFMERTNEAVEKHSELMGKLKNMLEAQVANENLLARQKVIEEAEEKKRLEDERIQRQESDEKIKQEARKEAEEKAGIESELAKEREIQSAIDAENRAKESQEIAVKAERERIELDQRLEREEAEKRERNKKHKATVHNRILDCIMKTGITDKQAKAIITIVAKGNAGNMYIRY